MLPALAFTAVAMAGSTATTQNAVSIVATTQDHVARPRIGLALGGGAARGLAHIGVMQWLDEHRIPVDLVGGTSMGGVMGGGFASGMTVGELRALVEQTDWAIMLAPDSPFTGKTLRRKEDARAFPSQLEFGLRAGLRLPGGLSSAQQVDLLLARMALPYYDLASFDDLPTPFRCVATDLKQGRLEVLKDGWLAQALRATMAIPGLFTPVERDGLVLVDGGTLNNVPADIVRAMGADVVIAVDVSADLTHEKKSDSMFAVLGESLDVMMRNSTRRALASATVVLQPDLKGMAGIDFHRGLEFMKRGYDAAEAKRDDLLRYAISEVDYEAYLQVRRAKRRTAAPVPAFVRVDGVPAPEARLIELRFRSYAGHPLDSSKLERDLTALTGAGRYEAATYRFVKGPTGAGLLITVRPKSYGPPFLLAALDLQTTQSANVSASVRGRLLFFDVLGAGSEARVDVTLGNSLKAAAELYRPLGIAGLFVAPRVSAERFHHTLFVDGEPRAEYRTGSEGAGIDVGASTMRRFELRAGYDLERVKGSRRIGDPLLPEYSGTQRYFSLRVKFDGQNGAVLPSRGVYASGRIRRFTSVAQPESIADPTTAEPADLLSAETDVSAFVPIGQHGRLFVRGAGGSSAGDTTVINGFYLGGPFRLGALNPDEQRGSNYVLGNAGYFHEVLRVGEGAIGKLSVGAWIDSGAAFERLLRHTRIETDLSGGLIMETPLGPILVAASVGTTGRHRMYFALGPILHR